MGVRRHSLPPRTSGTYGCAERYDADALREWSKRIVAERWTDAYVFLKHEGFGPEYALFLDAVAAGTREPALPQPELIVAATTKDAARSKKGLARAKPPTAQGEATSSRVGATVRRKSA